MFFLNSKFQILKYYTFPNDTKIFYNFKNIGNNSFIVSNDIDVLILNKNFKTQKINVPVSVLKNHIVTRFFQKQDKSLLISNANGIYSLTNNKLELVYSLKDNQVFSFYEDTFSKDIWIGTLKGAFQFKKGLISETNISVYLSNNIVLDIKQLLDKTWWFCTSENGAFNCNMNAFNFDVSDGLKKNAISFIKKDGNDIYTISLDGTISLIQNNKIATFNISIPEKEKTFGTAISDAFQTQNDGVFFLNSTLYQIKNKSIKKYLIPGYNEIIYHFPQNDLPNLYTITKLGLRKGVNFPQILFFSTPIWLKMKNEFPDLPPIYFEDNDTIFNIFTKIKSGLMKVVFDNKTAKFNKINFPYNIQDVWMTANKSLIIGTLDKGLCILKNNKQKFYTADDGLLSNYCTKTYYINNRIWICSNKGVSRLELDKNESIVAISNFTTNDLLIYNEANDLLIHKGNVYVATNKGVSVFPENINLTSSKPKVFIENIQINNKDQSILNKYNLLYNENNISIHYKTISFRSAKNIIYKYKLINKKNSSTETTKLDRIQLSSLSAGTYIFSVWARNIDGVWSDNPATITFTINSPFWKKWWFLLALYVLFAILVFIVARRRLKAFQEKNEIEKRIVIAELKAIRLHMNPHFIYNTLSSLQYYILFNKNKEASKYLSTFSVLLRLIMKYAKENEIFLKDEIYLLEKYIELEQMRFENKIEYVLNVNNELLDCLIPPLILLPFVENAIKYGISNIKGKGKLAIDITKENNFLVCKIQDNGIGRVQSELLKDDENIKFESTGINYTRERLRLLSNKKNSENLIVITDLYENNLSKGTLIKINIPI
jgi:hypothetical protein